MNYSILAVMFSINLLIVSCGSIPVESPVTDELIIGTQAPIGATTTLTSSRTTTSTYTITPTVPGKTPTHTINPEAYKDEWVEFESRTLGIRFEYPYLYDFPTTHPMLDDLISECSPRAGGFKGYLVGDWIDIEAKGYRKDATPTPFAGRSGYWITDSIEIVDIGGESGTVVYGRDSSAAWEDDIADAIIHYWGFATVRKGNQVFTISYFTPITGTPICLFNYPISNHELFTHIIESFEFTN